MAQFKATDETPSHLQGYAYGMRQPARVLSIQLQNVASTLPWMQIDDWLQAWIGSSPDELMEMERWVESSETCSNVARLAWRVALSAAAILRGCGIPALEPGRVLAVSQDKSVAGLWQCVLAVPRCMEVPDQATMLAYEVSIKWLSAVAAYPEKTGHLNAFYREIETQVIPVLLSFSVASSSAMTMLRAASDKNIPWSSEGMGMYQIGWGQKSLRFQSTHLESDSAIGISVASNKLLAAQWMRRAGLPAPVHHFVNHLKHAVQAAHLLGWPVVVKPVDCERGEGVTVDVDNEAKLDIAFGRAQALSAQVLVERQVQGSCHRLLVVRGQVMYVVKRLPVAVLGDGCHTVRELVAIKMNCFKMLAPWDRPPPLIADTYADVCLRQVGLSLDSIVPNNTWAPLRRIESTADGGRDEDMASVIHPDNRELAIRAAALFGLDVAGVDIISTDVSVSWYVNGAIINEINASPVMGASQSSLNAMATVMEQLVSGNARIRIEAYIGGDAALQRARQRQGELIADGTACYLTSHELTLNTSGHIEQMTCDSLFFRCSALLMDKSVGAIVIVVQNDELCAVGLPVDRFDYVEKTDNGAVGAIDVLLNMLMNHTSLQN